MSEVKKAYLAAAMQITIIGFSFMVVKVSLESVSPIDLLTYRFFFASVAAFVHMRLRKDKLKVTVVDIKKIFPIALFYPNLFFTFQVFGLVYTSSSEAGIIQAVAPIFTIILAGIVLKEKTSGLQKIFIFFSIVGIAYISIMNGKDALNFSLIGTSLIVLSSLSYAVYIVFARKLTKNYSFYTLTYVMTFMGFFIFLMISVSLRMMSGMSLDFLTPLKSPLFLASVLYIGVLASFISFLLSNYALSKIEASKISILANLTPVITTLVGVFMLNESLKMYHLLGMAITLIGVIGANIFGKKRKEGNHEI